MTWPRRVTYVLWAVSAVLLWLAVLAVRDLGEPGGTWLVGGVVLSSAVPFVAGYLATRHDPTNWVGTWLTAAGANIVLQMAHGNWAEALAAPPSELAASPELLNLTQGIWMGWFLPFAMVLLLFPDGRPADALARRTAVALPLLVVAFNLLLAIVPGPLMPPLADWPPTRSSALPLDITYAADELPEHVSLTAYYVASEGVANAVKHAEASRVAVDVRQEASAVHVAVRDDGRGGARIAPGSGLAMLRDRVDALGGRLTVASDPHVGTSIEAVIPCAS